MWSEPMLEGAAPLSRPHVGATLVRVAAAPQLLARAAVGAARCRVPVDVALGLALDVVVAGVDERVGERLSRAPRPPVWSVPDGMGLWWRTVAGLQPSWSDERLPEIVCPARLAAAAARPATATRATGLCADPRQLGAVLAAELRAVSLGGPGPGWALAG